MRQLLLGCGTRRERRITANSSDTWDELVTLDMNPDLKPAPDIVWNLENLPYPLADNEFDEIHAYEVLEHVGRQGDWQFFFAQFDEFARILKPGGVMCITSPAVPNPWVWGDPGHTRYMGPQVYAFLSRDEYDRQLGNTAMTDYRPYFKSNWGALLIQDGAYVLKNKK